MADPRRRLGRGFVSLSRPSCDPAETALAQVKALGHDPRDVRHIVVTHMDLDHAGGLPDFPWARVHLHQRELDAASRPRRAERARYRPHHLAHGPKWSPYRDGGEDWFGFSAVRQLDGLADDVLLIPLHGHTRGHSGVAVRDADRWLLHGGDAFFHPGDIDPAGGGGPLLLNLFQRRMQVDGRQRVHNRERLRRLRAEHSERIEIFAAHDPYAWESHTTSGG